MDQEFSKWLATLGVGGALAAIVYYQARKDAMMYQEKLMALYEIERQRNLVEMARTDKLIDIIKENTHQTTVNTEVLRSLHKRLDREEDEREEQRRG